MKPFMKNHPRGFRKSFTPRSRIKRQFPKINKDNIKGIKICRQAKARWMKKFDKRQTPGRDYYWLAGVCKSRQRRGY
jgi:5'-nucleotidase